MKEQARKEVTLYVEKHGQRHRLYPRSIRIKTQKSRWGSCGIHDDINMNWLLIIAPPAVMEYVVVHELCHIRHRNHSQDFWQLVEDHLPDYRRHRNWLKQHGHSLMLGL
nr:M48 family metallopeptidase [Methylomarinum sp. Ch1-1]MDP4519390.1 M48 family metallopeptidase [Methylomarinum sp. Ch1-1]